MTQTGRVLHRLGRTLLAALVAASMAACASKPNRASPAPTRGVTTLGADVMVLTSEAFQDGARIPSRYTCDGANVAPPLRWTGVPRAAAELALIVDDPDAPGGAFVHWVVYAIPAGAPAVAEGEIPAGAAEGTNGFGHAGWGGPCPPRGDRAHRYVFHLDALTKRVGLPAGATAARFRSAMGGLVAAEATLTGSYGR